MPAIELPALPRTAGVSIRVVDFGRDLSPSGGGEDGRVDRLGTRHEMTVSISALAAESCGPSLVADLALGRTAPGVAVLIREPGRSGVDYGAPLVATAGVLGSTLPVKGLPAGRVVPKGKWLSVIINGRRYAYFTTAEITASGAGTANLPIYPMIRRAAPLNAVVELAAPRLEGLVRQPPEWSVASIGAIGIPFTVRERG